MNGLTYIGRGAALIGIPARDLTETDIAALPEGVTVDLLLASGLYKKPGDFDEQDATKVLSHVRKTKKESE